LKTLDPRPIYQPTRQRILAKADELIRHFGLAKTTVADIAAGLGMSPANIYKYFPSKHSLIEASVEEKLAQLQRSIEAAVSSSSGARARIERLVLTIFRWQKRSLRHEPQLFDSSYDGSFVRLSDHARAAKEKSTHARSAPDPQAHLILLRGK
jgi:AcrR family transcriptional regulator